MDRLITPARETSPPFLAPGDGEAPGGVASRLLRAELFIEERLASALEVAELARVAGFSPRHFQRLFQERHHGETVHRYIRRLRIERACLLLKGKDEPVTEVGLACGFATQSSFCKAFLTLHGVSPSRYREDWEAERSLAADPAGAFEVELGRAETLRLVCFRHLGSPFESAGSWRRLLAWAWKRKLLSREARLYSIYWDGERDDTPLDSMRTDLAIAVDREWSLPPGFYELALPGGPVAIHRFRGKPDALERRWTWFAEHWLRRSRLHLRMPLALEEYSGSQLSLPRLAAALALLRPTLECALLLPVEEPAPPARGGRSA